MALVVLTDSYISQIDATAYVSGHYATTDIKHTTWDALSSDDKDAYLRKAAQIIDRQPFIGFKALLTQTMEFPRAIYTDNGVVGLPQNNMFYGDEWYIQTDVPDIVKYAQVELALELSIGISKRTELQRQGVKSFSIGSLSENYGSGKENALPYEAKCLLAPFLAGSVRIC